MSDSRVAGGLDRLPWLSDEPVRKTPPTPRSRRDLAGWALAAVLIVAAVSFCLGSRSEAPPEPTRSSPSATVAVPQAHPTPQPQIRVAPQAQVEPAPQPEVRIIRVPEVRIVPVPVLRAPREAETRAAEGQVRSKPEEKIAPSIAAPAPRIAPPAVLTPWPPRVIAGAAGRIVQIGAYGSVHQAKRGWVDMARAYPALRHLPAVVVISRNSHRRLFYRFQIGTTSQAHSEILCQRMQSIALSCAVVGLPWKSKVER
jgi:hypothetical protein